MIINTIPSTISSNIKAKKTKKIPRIFGVFGLTIIVIAGVVVVIKCGWCDTSVKIALQDQQNKYMKGDKNANILSENLTHLGGTLSTQQPVNVADNSKSVRKTVATNQSLNKKPVPSGPKIEVTDDLESIAAAQERLLLMEQQDTIKSEHKIRLTKARLENISKQPATSVSMKKIINQLLLINMGLTISEKIDTALNNSLQNPIDQMVFYEAIVSLCYLEIVFYHSSINKKSTYIDLFVLCFREYIPVFMQQPDLLKLETCMILVGTSSVQEKIIKTPEIYECLQLLLGLLEEPSMEQLQYMELVKAAAQPQNPPEPTYDELITKYKKPIYPLLIYLLINREISENNTQQIVVYLLQYLTLCNGQQFSRSIFANFWHVDMEKLHNGIADFWKKIIDKKTNIPADILLQLDDLILEVGLLVCYNSTHKEQYTLDVNHILELLPSSIKRVRKNGGVMLYQIINRL